MSHSLAELVGVGSHWGCASLVPRRIIMGLGTRLGMCPSHSHVSNALFEATVLSLTPEGGHYQDSKGGGYKSLPSPSRKKQKTSCGTHCKLYTPTPLRAPLIVSPVPHHISTVLYWIVALFSNTPPTWPHPPPPPLPTVYPEYLKVMNWSRYYLILLPLPVCAVFREGFSASDRVQVQGSYCL